MAKYESIKKLSSYKHFERQVENIEYNIANGALHKLFSTTLKYEELELLDLLNKINIVKVYKDSISYKVKL